MHCWKAFWDPGNRGSLSGGIYEAVCPCDIDSVQNALMDVYHYAPSNWTWRQGLGWETPYRLRHRVLSPETPFRRFSINLYPFKTASLGLFRRMRLCSYRFPGPSYWFLSVWNWASLAPHWQEFSPFCEWNGNLLRDTKLRQAFRMDFFTVRGIYS